MGKEQKLFYYSYIDGLPSSKFDPRCVRVVSEVELPRPSKKHAGKCACWSYNMFPDLESGEIVDIAMCDPIVLKKCEALSLRENPAPEEFVKVMKRHEKTIVVFRYHGGRVWIDRAHVCLLKDFC